MARNLHGQTISLGLLLSNSVPFSNIDTINSVFSILLKRDFFDWLSKVQSRGSLEDGDDSVAPIISDVRNLKRMLSRTFDVRHILVHEFPETSPCTVEEIGKTIATAISFIEAADEGFTQSLYGLYPISQQAMNRVAWEESDAAEEQLKKLVREVIEKTGESTIAQVQQAWSAFASAEAKRIAQIWTGGSMYPLVYYTALKVLTSDRVEQLQLWLNEELSDSEPPPQRRSGSTRP